MFTNNLFFIDNSEKKQIQFNYDNKHANIVNI